MKQIHHVLSSCKTGDAAWHVEAPMTDDVIEDWENIRDFYTASANGKKQPRFEKVRAEAMDFGAHLEKTPSAFVFRACVGDDPCAECRKVIEARRMTVPEWSPQTALRHLAWNGYRLPFPELRDPEVRRRADDAATNSTCPGDVVATCEESAPPGGVLADEKSKEIAELQRQLDQALDFVLLLYNYF